MPFIFLTFSWVTAIPNSLFFLNITVVTGSKNMINHHFESCLIYICLCVYRGPKAEMLTYNKKKYNEQ